MATPGSARRARLTAVRSNAELPDDDISRTIGGVQIQTADEAGEGSAIIAIAGKSGAGKTPLAATLLDWKNRKNLPAFWFDVEGGLRSARSRGSDIEAAEIMTWADFLKVRGSLERGIAERYCGICLDNASELADLAMDTTMEERDSNDPNRPNLLDWRINSRTVVTQAVRKLRDIGRKYHIPIIINVWEREERGENGEGAVRAIHIDLNAKLRNLLIGACDLSLWLEVMDDGSRIVHTAQSRRTDSKVRRDVFNAADMSIPRYIHQPTLPPILDALIDGVVWPEGLGALPEGMNPRFVRQLANQPPTAKAKTPGQEARERRAARAQRA